MSCEEIIIENYLESNLLSENSLHKAIRFFHPSRVTSRGSSFKPIASMGTINTPGTITLKHNASKKVAYREVLSEKRLKMPFGLAKSSPRYSDPSKATPYQL